MKYNKKNFWYHIDSLDLRGIFVVILVLIVLYYFIALSAHLKFLDKIFYGFDDIDKQNFVSIILFFGLIVTIWESYKFRVQTKILEEKPIMSIFIRHRADFKKKEDQEKIKGDGYFIKTIIQGEQPYIFRLRNLGKGVAFNVEVKSKDFEVNRYETKIFSPLVDEHCVSICGNGNKKIEELKVLNGKKLDISCISVSEKPYCFRYKIIDIEKKEVVFEKEIKPEIIMNI